MTPGTARRTLAAAITTALTATALTVAPAATATPRTPAPTAGAPSATGAGPATRARSAPTVLPGTRVTSVGPSGFLGTVENARPGTYGPEHRWYRPDGTSTWIASPHSPPVQKMANRLVSDIVPVIGSSDGSIVRLHDMSAPPGTAPDVVDLGVLGPHHRFVAAFGSTLLVEVGAWDTPLELRLVSRSGTRLIDRKVTGVPTGIRTVLGAEGAPGTAFVAYRALTTGTGDGTLTVDLASAKVTGSRPGANFGNTAFSATRTATGGDTGLTVTERATGAETRIAIAGGAVPLAFLGDFVAYSPPGSTAFSARSLTDGTTVALLDTVTSAMPAPGGGLLVSGGTAGQGEGVYRITAGPDGVPAAELAAAAREDTTLKLLETGFGDIVGLRPPLDDTSLAWRLSRPGFDWTVELVHRRTGQKRVWSGGTNGVFVSFRWDGYIGASPQSPGGRAPGGDYTWRLTAKPRDAAGPDLETGGEFRLGRPQGPHDVNDNGSPDLLYRYVNGSLASQDTVWNGALGEVAEAGLPTHHGNDWEYYPQLEAVGDVSGASAPDVIGVDRVGTLWLHEGTGWEGRASLAPRVKIGRGWQVYTRLAGGSDLTGDGRADLVAVDGAGDLYLYAGTGVTRAPFAPREKIGFGWGTYDGLIAPGNIGGADAGDLLARDKAGVLWLYLGKGDGRYAPRVRVGAGWGQYAHLVGIGDADLNGRPDLYAIGPYNTVYTYSGTGEWRTPFRTRKPTKLLADLSLRDVDKVF
ncbi:VCBS repeat-containing protein [Streptomyces sp. NPDC093249]|uniref:VCBS repeat-containing protein n=1 Tax=unclassified Streptomyces TaxID=2593676 RepID=UPI00382E345C